MVVLNRPSSWLPVCLTLFSFLGAISTTPPSIIIDTDIFSDVDDVGALAIAHVLHSAGDVNLLGVMINTPSVYGALAVSSINAYYGNDVPIAAMRPLTNETFVDTWSYSLGEFASKVAWNWPRKLSDATTTPEPVELYRKILEEAEDKVTIVSLGFLDNLEKLMDSVDDAGRSGVDLISDKVSELVVMGGRYPYGWEFNFAARPESAQKVINHWPRSVPVTYSGFELGADIFSGGQLAEHAPEDSPVLAAYQWYVGRCSTTRESWDPITLLYGALGLSGRPSGQTETDSAAPALFSYANECGYNTVMEDGVNRWVNDTAVTNQHWLRLAEGVSNTTVAWLITQYLAQGPAQTASSIPLYESDLPAVLGSNAL